MTDIRSFDEINEFLGAPERTADAIETTLSELSESELTQINEALELIDLEHDPISDCSDLI